MHSNFCIVHVHIVTCVTSNTLALYLYMYYMYNRLALSLSLHFSRRSRSVVAVAPVHVLFYAHCWFKFLLRTALDAYMTPTINPPQININCA